MRGLSKRSSKQRIELTDRLEDFTILLLNPCSLALIAVAGG
jgi:hypothetical protein